MRIHDWPERLSATLQAARTRAYGFGEHDCVMHACDCALAVTGSDPAVGVRGTYAGYPTGMLKLRRRFHTTSIERAADKLWERTPVAMARRGDWALAEVAAEDGVTRPCLLVVDGVFLIGPEGMTLPRSAARVCWKVG